VVTGLSDAWSGAGVNLVALAVIATAVGVRVFRCE
jgi:hypothetical protein